MGWKTQTLASANSQASAESATNEELTLHDQTAGMFQVDAGAATQNQRMVGTPESPKPPEVARELVISCEYITRVMVDRHGPSGECP